jgi:CHAT domain-containing protein
MIDLGAAEEIDAGIGKLRGAVDQFRKTFENKKRPDERAAEDHFRKLGTGLYTKPFAPLRAALGEAALIYLAPDGALNLLPFEALVDEQGNYLVESRRFVYLSSGRDLLRPAAAPARGTVIFADPDFDLDAADRRKVARALLDALAAKPGSSLRVHAPHIDLSQRLTAAPSAPRLSTRGTRSDELRGLKWESLKNFGPEADEIEKELAGSGYGPVTVYRGKEALEDVFKALPAPRVLHMITHGKYLPNRVDPEDRVRPVAVVPGLGMGRGFGRLQVMEDPLFRSWLVLAGANKLSEDEDQPDAAVDDGWLTAGEIAALDLRGTELVVLSACDTGRGDVRGGEGVYGLRRAFLYAGARTLVTSLFPVPDEQTRELMGQFYRSLKEGRGKLSALHEAQLALIRQRRQSGGAAHPFFWASFVLVGDPD